MPRERRPADPPLSDEELAIERAEYEATAPDPGDGWQRGQDAYEKWLDRINGSAD